MIRFAIRRLDGREILDSRGRPTVLARCELEGGAVAEASVPSGASTGSAEALELRDRDPRRYRGLGCRRAAENIRGPLAQSLAGRLFASQSDLDRAMIDLDGTHDKSRLGANALLAVSLATARAVAVARRVPLYQHLADLLGERPQTIPRPTINLFSGGKHAGKQSPLQDILLVPSSATTMDEALATTYAVYQSAMELIAQRYHARPLRADEGGLAPEFPHPEAMLSDAVEAIQNAGFAPGRDVALAVDVASTHFFHNGVYELGLERLDAAAMTARLSAWVEKYPIVSLEDGLHEEAWADWPQLCASLGQRALIVGDDLLCTKPDRIRQAIEKRAANTLLLKVNQVGTLSEAMEACRLARNAGWRVTASARSGETEDHWLADLAVGWGADQIKIGSITQSERLAKYNRLLEIESALKCPLVPWPNPRPPAYE